MIQDVIVQRLHISKQGERHYFQINVPRQAEKIVGLELGAFLNAPVFLKDRSLSSNNWLSIKRNRLLGEVQLQTSNQPNFFFTGELVQEDRNIGVTDFIKTGKEKPVELNRLRIDPPPQKNYWRSQQFTHGGRKELDEILTDNDRVIYGCFKDVIGKTEKKNINYTVLLYLWFQQKD